MVNLLFHNFGFFVIKTAKTSIYRLTNNLPLSIVYYFFNLKEFRTTEIEENAMAAPAKMGLSKIPKNG